MQLNSAIAVRREDLGLYHRIAARLIAGRMPDSIQAGPARDAEKNSLMPLRLQGATALIDVVGVLLRDLPEWVLWIYEGLLSDTLRIQRAVEAAAADPEVETIVLRLNSPGGTVEGLPETAAAIAAAAASKPVIAQVNTMACSAAYYLAAQAGQVRMGATDVVGSIGVIWPMYDYHKQFAEEGVEAIPNATSEYKYAGMEGTEITEAQRGDFMRLVDQYFADFKGAVQRGRRMNDAQLAAVSDARCYLGDDAVRLRLVDRVATLDDTLAELTQQSADRAAGRARMAKATVGLMART